MRPLPWAAVGSCVIGLVASVVLFLTLREFQKNSARSEVETAANQKVELLRNRIQSSLEVLHSIQSLCASRPRLSRAEFHDFVSGALSRHREIQALSWNPCVAASERASLEKQAALDGLPDFTFTELDAQGALVPAAPRASYVPVYFLEPREKNRTALGFDLSVNPTRQVALEHARDHGIPTATEPLRLVQESGDQLGFVVVLPVFHGAEETVADRRAHLIGFVSAAFRIGDLVHATLGELSPPCTAIAIYDAHRAVFQNQAVSDPKHPAFFWPKEIQCVEPIEIAGLHWNAVFSFVRPEPVQSWAALLAGLVITALTAGYIVRGARHTLEIETRVRQRTAELAIEIAVRKRTEKELRKAEQNYRSIFENSIEGIFQSTPEGRYLSANPALARIYGYDSVRQLMDDLSNIERQLYVAPDRRAEFIRTVQAEGSVSDFESQIRRRDGRIIWISEKARAVRDTTGELLYYEGTVADITARKQEYDALEVRVKERTADLDRVNRALRDEITERKRAEDAAEAASQAKSEFLAHMSHEIRTPLNAILGYAQILQRDPALPAKQRDAVETIADSGNHLFRLIDEVLDLSKIEAGRMELVPTSFDLPDLIKRLELMFRHRCRQKHLQLHVEVPEKVSPLVQGDEGKLLQVLINLLGNAVKFTTRGEIRLRVTARPNNAFQFEVIDTGMGIPAAEQSRIFAPFTQTTAGARQGGTGLGLTISQRYISLMGGQLDLHSEPEIGSTFTFTLTLPAVTLLRSPLTDGFGKLAPHYKVNALVVDDIKPNREVLAGLLTLLGCETLVAESGEQAIEMAREAKPDIIFMDIWMDGINGIEATQQILQELPQTKIVAHSASAFDHEQKRYLDAGFDDFFAKPFRHERICECLRNLLQVEFIPAPSVTGSSPLPKPLLAPLPIAYLQKLKEAAGDYNVTALKNILQEMQTLGDKEKQLSEYLLQLLTHYEMENILAVLAEMESYPASLALS